MEPKLKRKGILPVASCRRILAKSGAKRISDEAAKALGEFLENVGEEVVTTAVLLAEHAGRKTVTEDDIRLATKT